MNTAITQYIELLLDKYNVQIIFQVPRSPYTNTLDLGVWMCLYASIKREHYLKITNVKPLYNSVL